MTVESCICEKCNVRQASVLACGPSLDTDRFLCSLCAVREQIDYWVDHGNEHSVVDALLAVEAAIDDNPPLAAPAPLEEAA